MCDNEIHLYTQEERDAWLLFANMRRITGQGPSTNMTAFISGMRASREEKELADKLFKELTNKAGNLTQDYTQQGFIDDKPKQSPMEQELLNLEGVEYVEVVENSEHTFDPVTQLHGLSMRVIVKGGKKKKIAKVILEHKYLGVSTQGNTCVEVKDCFGRLHSIRFERVI